VNRSRANSYLQYWNWFKYQDNLSKSPVFDGSDTSLGGDGEYFAHNGSVVGAGRVWLPSGKGGGCVKSGPFVGYAPFSLLTLASRLQPHCLSSLSQ